MSWDECRLVDHALERATEIASTPFQDEASWRAEAAFTLLMVNLKDALLALKRMGSPIAFSDDIEGGRNITDLVVMMRNVACHIGSRQRLYDAARNGSLSFCRIHGAGTFLKTDTMEIGSPYTDDVAFLYGSDRILLRRHIYRAIEEADSAFDALCGSYGYHRFKRR